MAGLSQQLQDAARSGVYRALRAQEIVQAASGSGMRVANISYGEKSLLMKRIAAGLEFPKWFGENWDALEDCRSDLSWSKESGHVLVFEQPKAGDDFGVLVDVLSSVAQYRSARGSPFFAVFIDPAGSLPLPELR